MWICRFYEVVSREKAVYKKKITSSKFIAKKIYPQYTIK